MELLTEIGWRVTEDQEWLSYMYGEGKKTALPAVPQMVRHSACGAEVRKNGRPKEKPSYREKFIHRWMSMEYTQLVLRPFISDGTNLKSIPSLEEQNVSTQLSNLITSAAMANVEVSV